MRITIKAAKAPKTAVKQIVADVVGQIVGILSIHEHAVD